MHKRFDKTTVTFLTLFTVLSLSATSAWLFLTDTSKPFKRATKDIPDNRFTSLHVEQFSKTGARVYTLDVPSAYHLPDTNMHYLTSPHIAITQVNQPTWNIQSLRASITPEGEEIIFQNNVVITHDAYENNKPGVFKTEELHYFTKKKHASTPLLVTWEQEDKDLKATGMQADLVSHRVELIKDVRAHFRPAAHG